MPVSVHGTSVVHFTGVLARINEISQLGTEFYLALTKANAIMYKAKIFITTNFSGTVNFSINSSTEVLYHGQTRAGSTATYDIPSYAMIDLDDSAIVDKGIHISASEPVNVLVVLSASPHDQEFISTFLLLPQLNLDVGQYEYFTVTGGNATGTLLLLVGNEDNTSVEIIAPFSTDLPTEPRNADSKFATVLAGTPYRMVLNRLQTFKYNVSDGSVHNNARGIRILSNKAVTVIGGNLCHSTVPEVLQNGLLCRPLLLQVPPDITWGREFLLAPFTGSTKGQYYKVVAARNETKLSLVCTNNSQIQSQIELSGMIKQLYTTVDVYCSLQSSQPVMVVQLANQTGVTNMILIPSTEHYLSSFLFNAPNGSFSNGGNMTHYITITVTRESVIGQLQFDTQLLSASIQWTHIYGNEGASLGYGCGFPISSGLHTVVLPSANKEVFVMVYGFSSSSAYGYQAGIDLTPSKLH